MAEDFTVSQNLLDESFDPADSLNYGLGIIVRGSGVTFCVLEFRRNKFIGLLDVDRNVKKVNPADDDLQPSMAGFLASVCNAFPWLKNPFRAVKVVYDGQQATLVPSELFDPEEKEKYFYFNFAKNPGEEIFCDHLAPFDAWQVYSIPRILFEAAGSVFPAEKMVHSSSLLIESVWINYKNRINAPHIFLQVRASLFDLMIFDGRQMTYFNTFTFQNPEDVAYYLVFVLEQLNFNPETIPLVLLGNIAAGDGLSDLLNRYVRHIDTVRRNESYKYSYMLNQLPPQAYFPLFNIFSCGL